jgi:hypothetical protein
MNSSPTRKDPTFLIASEKNVSLGLSNIDLERLPQKWRRLSRVTWWTNRKIWLNSIADVLWITGMNWFSMFIEIYLVLAPLHFTFSENSERFDRLKMCFSTFLTLPFSPELTIFTDEDIWGSSVFEFQAIVASARRESPISQTERSIWNTKSRNIPHLNLDLAIKWERTINSTPFVSDPGPKSCIRRFALTVKI